MGIQQELFDEFKDRDAKKRLIGKGVLPDKAFVFTFGYEKVILVILGFIIILAITFAFGFERGKKTIFVKRVTTQPITVKAAAAKPTAAKPIAVKVPAPILKQVVQRPYTIQVATFKSKQYAQEEAEKLRKKGFPTTIIGINGLYEVWAGEYSDQKEASQALSMLSKIYKDCYIRKR